jgi:superfamily I DNA and/or RNA helicase
VRSAHEYQGREADVAVVSLVRDRRGFGPAHAGVGHLSEPELANVLFSRARKLLIVVGNFAHFRDYAAESYPFWRSICETWEQVGTVLPAETVLGPSSGVPT